ncbi:MAG: NAD(+)/NADH kinase [Lentisphaeria bacterium]|nr:NAD(+)/NADH kinase [Lentisphaeria bacterium]
MATNTAQAVLSPSEASASGRLLRIAICGRHLDDLRQRLQRFPMVLVDSDPDLVISYGGDGALLGAERDWPGIPKCPIRDVRRNPKCSLHGEDQVLDMLFEGRLRRSLLARLLAEGPGGAQLSAINDVIVSKGSISSAVRTRIRLDDEVFQAQNVGDGLVVATPFGSTGYFQSITRGCFRVGIGLAFNNPMNWLDYVVVHEDTVISVEILRGPALFLADNNPARFNLKDGDRLTVRRAEEPTLAYGIDVFRCRDCYRLRENGV